MRTPGSTGALIATAALALGTGAVQARAAAPADPAAAWAAMQKCGSLANDEARHACTDAVLRNAGAMAPPEARAAERRRSFGLELPKVRAPTIVRKRASEQAARFGPAPARAAVEEDPDQITVKLERVTLQGDGKLVMSTAEGAVWRQVEDDPVRPMPKTGQTMQIERTALGGFLCKTDRWTAFRCTREP